MRKRWVSLLLALALLLCSSCGVQETDPSETEEPAQSAEKREVPIEHLKEDPLEEEPEEPEEPEKLVWSTEPVLSESEMPGSHGGLELPIQGATGYAIIEMPLWEDPKDCETARLAVEEWEKRQAEKKAAAEEAARAEEARRQAEAAAAASTEGEASPEEDPTFQLPEVPESETNLEASAVSASPAPDIPEEPAASGEGEMPLPEETIPPDTPEEQEPPAVPELPPAPPEAPPEPEPEAEPAPEPEPVPEPIPELPPEEEEPRPSLTEGSIAVLPAGTAMTVLQEKGDWWKIRCVPKKGGEETTGWVEHRNCMVNLPDVIPSMIYNATNAYASRFVSCGKTLEGVTGQQLYTGKTMNRRLGEEEFMMPVLYSMAFPLCEAQRAALKEGNCLVLYEGYRPQAAQMKVAKALKNLMKKDSAVKTAINAPPWSISWFIATSTSNHQMGYAVDVSLARVSAVETCKTGDYGYIRVREYEVYEMPTPIHELSPAAATFTTPIGPNSTTAWKSGKLTEAMKLSESGRGLQGYCTGAGLSPLSSEWWHFNDLASRSRILKNPGKGDFEITVCRSTAP